MNTFRRSNCPFCYSKDFQLSGEIDYRKPIMFSTREVDLEMVPELCQCKTCFSWFTQNIICEELAKKIYSEENSGDKWPRKVTLDKSKNKNIISRLDNFFTTGKRLLDIGCNTGELLDYARTRGVFTSGVELSLYSREILAEKNHTFYDSIDSVAEKFDVITAFDLVEHLYDFPKFLNSVRPLLADSGVIIILTGDNSSFSARVTKKHWWYLKAPEHISFPSSTYFKRFCGLNVLSIDRTYASKAYDRLFFVGVAQMFRKAIMGGHYEGLPSLGPDHMLVTMKHPD